MNNINKRKHSNRSGGVAKYRKKTQKHNGNLGEESEVIFLGSESKNTNKPVTFANISHKQCHGANNWQQFIQSGNVQVCKSNNKTKHLNKSGANMPSDSHNTTVPKSTLKVNEKLLGFRHINKTKGTHGGTKLTKQIAMDCEMVGVEIGVNTNMLARVSLVNAHGDCIYDKFVKPTEPILDYRTRFSGVRPKNLENAEEFKTVQKEVAELIKGRILVGHALKNDLSVLFLSHPNRDTRDTSKFKRFREGGTPKLKKLAKKYLGATIQEGEHCSIQDALAAMQLYRMFRKEWETSLWSNSKDKKKSEDVKNKFSMMNQISDV